MAQVKIFVEDFTMGKFLADYVLEHFNTPLNLQRFDRKKQGDIFAYGGWSEWINLNDKFSEFTDKGYTNLLFVDADDDAERRKAEINQLNEKYKLKFELFVFPDDGITAKGIVEDLLEQITTHKEALDCFYKYEKCIADNHLHQPSAKTKLYTYAEVLTNDEGRKKNLHKDPERDYRNANWDLNHKNLKPLRDFLSKHF